MGGFFEVEEAERGVTAGHLSGSDQLQVSMVHQRLHLLHPEGFRNQIGVMAELVVWSWREVEDDRRGRKKT